MKGLFVAVTILVGVIISSLAPVYAKGDEEHGSSDDGMMCSERLVKADVVYKATLNYTTDNAGRVYVRDGHGKGMSLKEYLKAYLPEAAKILCIDRRNEFMAGTFFIFYTFYTR